MSSQGRSLLARRYERENEHEARVTKHPDTELFLSLKRKRVQPD